MSFNPRRLAAVAAALRSIRNLVVTEGLHEDWSTEPYNNAITLLEGAIDTDTDHLTIGEEELSGRDLLVHLDASIAFLETYAGGEDGDDTDDDDDDDDDGVLEDDDDDLDISEDDENGDAGGDDDETGAGAQKPKGSTILGFPRRR